MLATHVPGGMRWQTGALFRDSISIQKIMSGDQYEGFDRFVDEMIEKKEKRISEIVDKEKF